MRPDGQPYGEEELGLMMEVQWLEKRKSGNGFLEAGLARLRSTKAGSGWPADPAGTGESGNSRHCAQTTAMSKTHSLPLVHLEPGYGEREQNDYKHEKGFKGSSF